VDYLEASSTSSRTAECTPIVLRESERVRLVFRPMLLVNDGDPRACVRGEFVYEKRHASGEWRSANTLSLATVKAGEQYKLELHSGELLTLLSTLVPLYRARWQENGPLWGNRTYVRMEAGLARFLKLGQRELEEFLDRHPEDATAVLGKLVRWLTSVSTEASKALAALDADRLPAVTALLGLSALKNALSEWEANASNPSEAFWQTTLSKHSFVLSHLFAHPVVVIRTRAYLGGKALDDKGGSYLDFLTAACKTNGVAMVEIKTPQTDLLGPEYRGGAFPFSTELSGAVAQGLKYRHTFATEFARLCRHPAGDLVLGGCPCVVLAGHAERELNTQEKRESFEAQRAQLNSVRIVTYDELFTKLRVTTTLLEGAAGNA
jgi:antiviral defense system Shedu protein SduA